MAINKVRVSETSVTGVAPITYYLNSRDAYFIDPKRGRGISGSLISQYLSSDLLDGDIDYLDSSLDDSEIKINDIPQLEDISVITNEAYIDGKGVTRARLVIRVRNSSGNDLLGVDARKAIKINEGGS